MEEVQRDHGTMTPERPPYTLKDGNQNEIVQELLDKGYTVDDVHNLPGLYDLVVTGEKWCRFVGGVTTTTCSARVEIKMPGKKLYPKEEKYHANDKHPDNLIVAYCAQDIIDWFEENK